MLHLHFLDHHSNTTLSLLQSRTVYHWIQFRMLGLRQHCKVHFLHIFEDSSLKLKHLTAGFSAQNNECLAEVSLFPGMYLHFPPMATQRNKIYYHQETPWTRNYKNTSIPEIQQPPVIIQRYGYIAAVGSFFIQWLIF